MFVHTDQRKTVKLPSHHRCSQRRVTIPTTRESGRSTVGLHVLGSELPWMVSTKGDKSTWNVVESHLGEPSNQGRLHSMFQFECGKCPPQAHFDHVVLSWWHCFENCETFRRQSLAGAGPLGSIAQLHCLSALALSSHDVRKPGCTLFPPRCLLPFCSVFRDRPCAFRPRAKQALLPLNALVRLFCSSEKCN